MKRLIALILLFTLATTSALAAADAENPKVRAITAFVRLERVSYQKQIDEAMKVLDAAKAELAKRGYETQTVRIVTQPFAELVKGLDEGQALAFLKSFNELSEKKGFMPNVGPAMLHDSDDPAVMQLLAKVLSTLPRINSSAIIADDDGIHWKTIRESAKLVHYLTDNTARSQGNFQFAATAMLQPLGPFYPGAYHTGAGKQFSLGFEGANIVQQVFGQTHGDFDASVTELTRQLTIHARAGEEVGNAVAAATGWSFEGVDPTPAPLGDASIGDAIERFTGARFGANGTMTASLAITTAVKKVQVKQVGYSGLMLPVMEDKRLAQRWAENSYEIDSLLAYSSVCGTGLDTVPLPGDVSEDQLVKIFGDVAALAWKWHKPLSARLQPVKGKKAGDKTDFDSQYLFNTTLHPIASSELTVDGEPVVSGIRAQLQASIGPGYQHVAAIQGPNRRVSAKALGVQNLIKPGASISIVGTLSNRQVRTILERTGEGVLDTTRVSGDQQYAVVQLGDPKHDPCCTTQVLFENQAGSWTNLGGITSSH